MAVGRTTITNISNQIVPLLYSPISNNKSVTDVPANNKGQLSIPVGGQVEIETQRLDAGQLERFRQLKLISYTQV